MFDDKFDKLMKDIITEADAPAPDPAVAGGASAPTPSPDAGGAPATDAGAAPAEKTPEEKMKELESKSGKSWISLASILAMVIETPFTPEDVEQINSELPSGITLDDFSNYSTNISKGIPNQMEPEKLTNMTAAAIKMFDNVKNVINRRKPETSVPPAEQMG